MAECVESPSGALGAVAADKEVRLTARGRKSGQPRGVTIWFVADGDSIGIGTLGADRNWVKNARANPEVELSFQSGLRLAGTFREVTSQPEDHARIRRQMAKKYLPFRIAGWFGQLPGVEPKPYILRFSEDRPNPLYRRICYTLAWSEVVSYAVLNSIGIIDAIINGSWRMRYFYDIGYLPIAGTMWLLGALGQLPRVKASTKGEGHERRYFYGSVWAVAIAQPVLWLLWRALPQTRPADAIKLVVFVGILAGVGHMARLGLLPRTRPIVPGELAVSD